MLCGLSETLKHTKHEMTYPRGLCWKYSIFSPKLRIQLLHPHVLRTWGTTYSYTSSSNAWQLHLMFGAGLAVFEYNCPPLELMHASYPSSRAFLSKQSFSETMICGLNCMCHTLRWSFQATVKHGCAQFPEFFRELTHLCTDVAQGLQSSDYRLSETLIFWYKNKHSSGSQGTGL